ncbi:MAG: DUF4136 domain-containing protein [Lautropia sp.]|nr:DUF4136 domain-containing protein [Lautropia sp.]
MMKAECLSKQRWPLARLAAACLLGVGVLSGCATPQQAQITTFQRPDMAGQGWAGKRFVIEPVADQRDSLAFARYAETVRAGLQKHGLVPVGGLADADLAVRFQYDSASTATTESRDTSSRVSFGLGGGYRTGWGIGIGVPIGGSSAAVTYYRHQLQLFIHQVEAAGGSMPAVGERLYESSLVTQAESAAIGPQMPGMIEALLADFPGQNGKTRTVEIPAAAE